MKVLTQTRQYQMDLSRVCAYCRIGMHGFFPYTVPNSMLTASGIASGGLFAECTFCRLPYCMSCRFKHQPSHQQAVVTLRSVINPFDPSSESDDCIGCSKSVAFSYSCCECDHAWCRNCWCENDISSHPHRIFNVVEPPRAVKSRNDVLGTCCTVAVVSHCSTCSSRKSSQC